jgi:hypothetical protein
MVFANLYNCLGGLAKNRGIQVHKIRMADQGQLQSDLTAQARIQTHKACSNKTSFLLTIMDNLLSQPPPQATKICS